MATNRPALDLPIAAILPTYIGLSFASYKLPTGWSFRPPGRARRDGEKSILLANGRPVPPPQAVRGSLPELDCI